MRILIATAVYYPMINGVAVFAHNLAMGLRARGHEVMVLTPSQTGKKYISTEDDVTVVRLKSTEVNFYPDQIHPVAENKKIFGIKMPHLFYKNGFRVSAFPASEVKKAIDSFRPDVVHIQVSDPIGLSVASYARKHYIPIVTTEHNQPEVITDPLKVPGLMKKPMNALLSSYFRNRQSKSDFVTMPTKQAIKNLFDKHPISVPMAAVSNGVDLGNFKPGKAPLSIYKKYNLPEDRPIVLYVGRVDPEKKIGTVIDAFSETVKKVPNALLVIAGDGVDKARLMRKVEDLKLKKSVRFLGRVLPPELYGLYKAGDVFVTASEIETQGIVLIEAAASGLPLIAVDKGAVAEICRDGENGILCQPGNVQQITEAMVKILTDAKLSKEFAEKSAEIAKEHDFEHTLDRFENIYRKVVGI